MSEASWVAHHGRQGEGLKVVWWRLRFLEASWWRENDATHFCDPRTRWRIRCYPNNQRRSLRCITASQQTRMIH
jgi:hypothetical protein